jgi:hypothetical protein
VVVGPQNHPCFEVLKSTEKNGQNGRPPKSEEKQKPNTNTREHNASELFQRDHQLSAQNSSKYPFTKQLAQQNS